MTSENYFYQQYKGKRWIDKSAALTRADSIALWKSKNKIGRVVHRNLSAVVKEMIVRQVGVWEGSD